MKLYIHAGKSNTTSGMPIMCMAMWSKNSLGLPYDVWVDEAGDNRNTKHSMPRIKINVDGVLVPVIISDNPRYMSKKNIPHISKIFKWVKLNKDVLISHWNLEITSNEAFNKLKKV